MKAVGTFCLPKETSKEECTVFKPLSSQPTNQHILPVTSRSPQGHLIITDGWFWLQHTVHVLTKSPNITLSPPPLSYLPSLWMLLVVPIVSWYKQGLIICYIDFENKTNRMMVIVEGWKLNYLLNVLNQWFLNFKIHFLYSLNEMLFIIALKHISWNIQFVINQTLLTVPKPCKKLVQRN